MVSGEWGVVTCVPLTTRYSLFALPDTEHEHPRLLRVGLEHVAGLAQQVGDVDPRERIGAFDHEPVARGEALERLAGLERRQRAAQPAQIEDGLGHAIVRVRSP